MKEKINWSVVKRNSDDFENMRRAHLEIFGPWLRSKGWTPWYSDFYWVKDPINGTYSGMPPDVAVMVELGLKKVTGSFLNRPTFE